MPSVRNEVGRPGASSAKVQKAEVAVSIEDGAIWPPGESVIPEIVGGCIEGSDVPVAAKADARRVSGSVLPIIRRTTAASTLVASRLMSIT